ncbi:MAG: NADH-quinone oxidoreductase subunit C [Bacteroidetes bacterium]|nr:NADH-quinone oxidoreductase subunit C [Bacteroidota bacterium]
MFKINTNRDQLVVNKLRQHFGEAIENDEIMTDMLCITVSKQNIYDVLLFLHENDEMQFNFLTTLCGMHYPEKEELGVVYHLHNFIENHRIRIKTSTKISNPVLPTITTIWPAANWLERETYDFYGIQFQGHPNLKRILNMDEMTDFPLRKDFPLEDQTREDKDNTMFGRK